MIRKTETKDRRIQSQYTMDGVTVTICKPAKPRKSERTWRSGAKYSISNLGGKAKTLRAAGLNHAKG
jgi:hypothetical protein